MGERQLVFQDARGHKRSYTLVDGGHLKFVKAFDSFLKKYLSEENATFRIERALTDEVLIIETEFGIIGRIRNGEHPEAGYRRYERRTDGVDVRLRFAYSGYAALDEHGPWTADRESLLPHEPGENLDLTWVRELEKIEQRRREIASMPKLDKKALNRFCKVWADTGHNEYVSDSEMLYVLDVDSARDELLTTIEALGLQVVDTSASASAGEVWVRSDPRVDIELEKWG